MTDDLHTFAWCKKLAESGYRLSPYSGGEKSVNLGEGDAYGSYDIPTLAELIDACGEMKLLVYRDGSARATNYEFEIRYQYFYGNTPEEAVVNLLVAMPRR